MWPLLTATPLLQDLRKGAARDEQVSLATPNNKMTTNCLSDKSSGHLTTASITAVLSRTLQL